MSIFIAPVIVVLVALAFSWRIVFLKANGRPVSRSLETGRYAVWSAAGFSAVLACLQAGVTR